MAHELNIGTINGLTAAEFAALFPSGGGSSYVGLTGKYSDIIEGVIAYKNIVTMGGDEWLICHVDETAGVFYMIKLYVDETVQFNTSSSNVTYAGSNIANKCLEYQESLGTTITDKLLTVNTFSSYQKIFIPKVSQISATVDGQSTSSTAVGDWDYFTDTASRIAYNSSGTAQSWWTSSQYSSGGVWYVYANGDFNGINPTNSSGFRPACCLAL